ncbi:MAG: hypothetical protein M3Y87_37325 [Myxococcota bacterium]|nr:hypothetical protein [Myxococcota bacterium]
MGGAIAHAHCEAILARAMRADDPVAAILEAARTDPELDPATRAALLRVDADGVRIQALLVARLRFERLLQGSAELAARFELDPAALTSTFRRYHRDVPMHAFFPVGEARSFAAWERER